MIRNEVIESLKLLANELNNSNIRWSLGASLMLYLRGIDCTVDDIDIIVHEDDYDKLLELLKRYPYVYMESNPKYQTKHFFSLEINKVDVDIMVDFRIKNGKKLYKYPFHIDEVIQLDNLNIPLSSLNEWLTAYTHMGRTHKVTMINNVKQNKKA